MKNASRPEKLALLVLILVMEVPQINLKIWNPVFSQIRYGNMLEFFFKIRHNGVKKWQIAVLNLI
jgi:hypothetical protein